MRTKTELTLEQTHQGVSDELLVSIEGVEEYKRKVKIKGEKKEALLTPRQKSVTMKILPELTSKKLCGRELWVFSMVAAAGPRRVRSIATCLYPTDICQDIIEAQEHISKDFCYFDTASLCDVKALLRREAWPPRYKMDQDVDSRRGGR
ncbi:hypothetical protein Tco_1080701 [Tanacetum coccineum]|uniref:Uncharacterized protein n=1 Tax=Tanacetum coccineum TaxID=301880 RepID=A0ABQ5HWK3_9ASTR